MDLNSLKQFLVPVGWELSFDPVTAPTPGQQQSAHTVTKLNVGGSYDPLHPQIGTQSPSVTGTLQGSRLCQG